MLLIVPPSDFAFLRNAPTWFVIGFAIVYWAAFLAMLGLAAWTFHQLS